MPDPLTPVAGPDPTDAETAAAAARLRLDPQPAQYTVRTISARLAAAAATDPDLAAVIADALAANIAVVTAQHGHVPGTGGFRTVGCRTCLRLADAAATAAAWRDHKAGPQPTLCQHCGQVIARPGRATQKYCGRACSDDASRTTAPKDAAA